MKFLGMWNTNIKGGITVEALLVFPLIVYLEMYCIFLIAEGFSEMAYMDGLYEGVQRVSNGTYAYEKIGGTIGELGAEALPEVLKKHVRPATVELGRRALLSDAKAAAIRHAEESGLQGRGNWFFAYGDARSAPEDEVVGILTSRHVRIQVYNKCWDGGSDRIEPFRRAVVDGDGEGVFVTRTGECYHVKSCKNSLDESCIPIKLDAAKLSGYRACKLCITNNN